MLLTQHIKIFLLLMLKEIIVLCFLLRHGQVLLVGDVLLVQKESGDLVAVRATPDGYDELARYPVLGEHTWNSPVLAGRYYLVRNDREAACYEMPLR